MLLHHSNVWGFGHKKEICCCHNQKDHGAGSGAVETLGYLRPGLHACNHSSIRIPSLVSFNSTRATALSQVLFSASVLGLETVSGLTWGPMWKIKLQYQAQNLVSFYDILLNFFIVHKNTILKEKYIRTYFIGD